MTNANAENHRRTRANMEKTSDKIAAFARDHPVVLIGGGIAVGVLVSALLPRRAGSKFARSAMAIAATAAETAVAMSHQARDKAEEAARDGRVRLSDFTASADKAGRRAAHAAADAGSSARQSGISLIEKAAKLARTYR